LSFLKIYTHKNSHFLPKSGELGALWVDFFGLFFEKLKKRANFDPFGGLFGPPF
jgi:hypothetical protein